jgi:hypothetical protein
MFCCNTYKLQYSNRIQNVAFMQYICAAADNYVLVLTSAEQNSEATEKECKVYAPQTNVSTKNCCKG